MSETGQRRGASPPGWRAFALALVVIAFGATATAASAMHHVNIVRQSPPPGGAIPKNTHYFTTIQEAVDNSKKGDFVLIEPGEYDESVKVTKAQSGIYIRGMDRNKVIVDGKHSVANGIEIKEADEVWVENLTVRNFEFGNGCAVEECGNDIWWNGGAGSGTIGAHGWFGSYLTAYTTGLHGGYGEFAGNEQDGTLENVYASGFADSGFYIGACRDCKATVNNAVMEDNALGYSGSNSSGHLVIENSVFKHNLVGIAPNSENPGDGPPPLDGACSSFKNTSPTPTFATTQIKRCEILRNNLVEENGNFTVPTNGSTEISIWGTGIELPGDYAVLVENNTIKNNPNDGVLGFEYPNPFEPPAYAKTIFFQLSGDRISNNTFENNGSNLPSSPFAGDVALMSDFADLFGAAPESTSVNNCASGNAFADTTFPANIEGTWGCQHKTTPKPGGAGAAAEYLLERQGEIKAIKETQTKEQPAPPAQPTMPNPCEGIPKNPLCP
jgi:Protein of unknown function (DUF1565)